MKAVVTVTGKDSVGIIARVSTLCTEYNANIIDITQSVLSEYFAMIMVVDTDGLNMEFTKFVDDMNKLGEDNGLDIRTKHEAIFNSMHKI